MVVNTSCLKEQPDKLSGLVLWNGKGRLSQAFRTDLNRSIPRRVCHATDRSAASPEAVGALRCIFRTGSLDG